MGKRKTKWKCLNGEWDSAKVLDRMYSDVSTSLDGTGSLTRRQLREAYSGLFDRYERSVARYRISIDGYIDRDFPDLFGVILYVEGALLSGKHPREISIYEDDKKLGISIGWLEGDIDLVHYGKRK